MNEIITLLSCIIPIIETKKQKQLQIIIQALLSMRGRITMLGLSRWSEKGGSYLLLNFPMKRSIVEEVDQKNMELKLTIITYQIDILKRQQSMVT